MRTTIFTLQDKEGWNNILKQVHEYDFYHCSAYHELDHSGAAFLFVVTDSAGDFIAIPLIKRPIEGTDYFDCTSVYGYGGPVSNKPAADLPETLIGGFQQELMKYFETQFIVAAFTRLHPVIDQDPFMGSIGTIVPLNQTVGIDLSLPVDLQRRQYRKSNKSEINQLRKAGFTTKIADTEAEIEAFIDIYTETMNRVNATDYYYFDEAYFKKFLAISDFKPYLLLAYKEDQIVAGAIFTVTGNIMQYHLAGTREAFIRDTPMKLVIDDARLLGSTLNLKYLHLGGGVGGKDDDPLFRFKSGFSDLRFTYKIWKTIVNETRYDELVALKSQQKELNKNYFPLYRG